MFSLGLLIFMFSSWRRQKVLTWGWELSVWILGARVIPFETASIII
jgi:hypothetical protein